MKLLYLLLFTTTCFAQIEVTPNGLEFEEYGDFLVIEADTTSASELYKRALKYVEMNYKDPDEVYKGQVEEEYLKIETFKPNLTTANNSGVKLPIDARYFIEMRFKDGRVRYEITGLSMTAQNGGRPLNFSGSIWKGYPIYNKKGELRLEESKKDIEDYFNSELLGIKKILWGESPVDDW